jgi:hypothetical protein
MAGNFGLAEHLLVLARALPGLPGGEPESPVGSGQDTTSQAGRC